MYTRSFRKEKLEIPNNYSGTALRKDTVYEEYTAAEDAKDEPVNKTAERDAAGVAEASSPVVSDAEDTDNAKSAPFGNFGIESLSLSDLLLVLIAVMLMQDGNQEDSELPLIMLLMLVLG